MKIIFYILMAVNGQMQPLASAEMQTLRACETQVAAFLERVEKTTSPEEGLIVQVGCYVVIEPGPKT